MPETVDIICENCGNVVLGTLERPSIFTDDQWAKAIARSRKNYRCSDCGPPVRSPPWWPHGWWTWPPQEEPPPFWPEDLDWPPLNEGAMREMKQRVRPRSGP